MWGWQVYFLVSSKVRAEGLFKEIDRRLDPVVFMIGFRTGDHDRPVICYEPEDMDFLAKDIARVEEVADQLDENDPLREMHYTGEGMNDQMQRRRIQKNFRKGLQKVLDESDSFPGKIHFIASAINRDGYDVYIVLQLNRSIYESHVFLHKVDPEERLKKHLSFIEAAKDLFLEDQAYRLYVPEAGRDRGPEREYMELLRLAARDFLYTIGWTGRGDSYFRLQPACEAVSLTPYERSENFGHLIIANKEHKDIEMTLKIDPPFPIGQFRKLRKVLQLSTPDIAVVTDSEFVYGLGRKKNSYDPKDENLFQVYFRGSHCYDILHHGQPLLQMRHGSPDHSGDKINREGFVTDAKRIFEGITKPQLTNLYNLSNVMATQDTGSMLVFIKDAAAEARRLRNQCIGIKPVKLNEELLLSLCSIDGAVIMDLDGVAHAKGAILDGIAGFEGDASRGSRYNSALTYYEYRGWKKPTMIVVVSEDGMVDVIPTLMPQIRHSEIIHTIAVLEKLNTPESFVRTVFYQTMELLQSRRFYHTAEECGRINTLKTELEALDESSGEYTLWVKHEDLLPNRLMNERYYLEENIPGE